MLSRKKLFLFDIDGTIAIGDQLLDGTRELLRQIEAVEGRALYITNNSTKSRKDYVEKFSAWDLDVQEEQFVTASYAACLYLREKYAHRKLYVVGTRSFLQELREFGLRVTEEVEEDVRCVVVGFDSELRYEKLQKACELLSRPDVDFVGTNPDLRCPAPFGFIPDCGSICGMITAAVERQPVYVGKPNPQIVELCLSQTGFSKEETLVVGDRLYTDIACGLQAGVETCVLLTGEASRGDLADTPFPPDYCFENVMELYRAFAEGRDTTFWDEKKTKHGR